MTTAELEDFYKNHPEGRSYKAIFARCPIAQQLKTVEVLKARLDRSLQRKVFFEFERFRFYSGSALSNRTASAAYKQKR